MTKIKTPYRNALRSKKMIKEAFIGLMLKKNVSDIKVKEIIEIADISKGTFYAHYGSISAILRELEAEYIAIISKTFEEFEPIQLIDDFYPMWLKCLKALESERDFFNVFLKSSHGNIFLKKVKILLIDYLLSNSNVIARFRSEYHARAYFAFAIGGSLVLIKQWFDCPAKDPVEKLASFLNRCILQGINSVKADAS